MQKIRLWILTCVIGLAAICPAHAASYQKYETRFMDTFDTVTTLIGYTTDKADFDAFTAKAHELLTFYHQIFDAYNSYDGVQNLYHLNENAANGPTHAEPALFELLLWLKDMQPLTQHKVNAAMGAVLSIWHTYREEGTDLTPLELLESAAIHCDFDDVILDEDAQTVFFSDPLLKLDLGAVAKGYAAEKIANQLLTTAVPSFILNLGGNVKCVGAPMDGRDAWGVGIQDPDDPAGYMDIVFVQNMSVVTSGDYQRFYTVNGTRYHHLIDPETCMPARLFRAVTVVTQDAALADFLSTALFLMPYEAGCALLDSIEDDVQAYWILMDDTVKFTNGMTPMLYSMGAQNTN